MLVAEFNAGESLERGFTTLVTWIPNFLGALAVLVIGYFVARAVGTLVQRLAHRGGLDRMLHASQGGSLIQRVVSSPSKLLGTIAFWALWLGAISLAVSVLGIDALEDFVAAIFAYLPNILAALLIFLVASAVAAGVAALASRLLGDTGLGKIVGTAAPILVMTIATFMILDQLQIAENIVTITYAALIGAVALGSALAFGLGGRDVAREMLAGAYAKGQANKQQFRSDLEQGVQRAREDIGGVKDGVQGDRAAATSPGSQTGATTETVIRPSGSTV